MGKKIKGRRSRDGKEAHQQPFCKRIGGVEKARQKSTHVGHELLTGWSDLFSESSTEHHDLLVVRSGTEDVLNVSSHVFGGKGGGTRMGQLVDSKAALEGRARLNEQGYFLGSAESP